MTGFVSKRKMGLSRMSDEVTQDPLSNTWGLRKIQDWRLKLCWLPKKCFLTGKNLWGKQAYCGNRWIAGPGGMIQDGPYWIEKDEFIIWNLRGKK